MLAVIAKALSRLAPSVLFISLLAGSIALALQAQQQAQSRLEQRLMREGQTLADTLERRLTRYQDELQRINTLWQHHQGLSEEEWTLHSPISTLSSSAITQVYYIDADLRVRWPQHRLVKKTLFDGAALSPQSSLYSVLISNSESQAPHKVFDLEHGALNLVSFLPRDKGHFSGAFVITLDIQLMVEQLLDAPRRNLLAVTLLYRKKALHQSGSSTGEDMQAVPIAGLDGVELSIQPSQGLISRIESPLPELILISGILVSLSLAMAFLWAQGHREQRQRSESTNQQLRDEIEQRRQAEARLEQEKSRLGLVLELNNHSHDGFIIHDLTNNQSLHFNRAAYRMLGYQDAAVFEQVLRQHPQSLLSNYFDWLKTLRKLTRQGLPRVFQLELTRADGGIQPVEINAELHEELGNEYLVAVMRDNSARLKLERELQELSQRDGLTNLFNRRHFDEELEREWRRAQRNSTGLGLLMIDVDHFKPYNDHFGHQAGDDALRLIAQTLQQCLQREGDQAFRYGGEELAVILAASAPHSVEGTAQQIHRRIAELRLQHPHSSTGQLTVSIGLCWEVPPLGQGAELLVKHADQALYAAKAAGRNRTYHWQTDSGAPAPSDS
ncbi:sensor domain-containing diguanylate cyclase [Atopomonas sediminilitoris]|uniref:sensor domain-containing diguanylate cyclase n=1 Tax=Atopomonas sediminilitoris TaxID=2919919 RepID=UPI001F4E4152|nr:sensor domain-containing diguanylate cyclase [Atopomonas sediminilitoris]MCJ8168268.1 sensor domain-containing diguanylate cyclase [Atopomonas sediminilitoris]